MLRLWNSKHKDQLIEHWFVTETEEEWKRLCVNVDEILLGCV
jgi:hypothetical protein